MIKRDMYEIVRIENLIEEDIEGSLSIKEIINILDETITLFEENKDNVTEQIKTMERFKEKASQLEVITMNFGQGNALMQSQLFYQKEIRKINKVKKPKFNIFSKNNLPEELIDRFMYFETNTNYPMEIALNKEKLELLNENNLMKFYYSLLQMKKNMSVFYASRGDSPSGFYKKPYGVIASNMIEYYINDMNKVRQLVPHEAIKSITRHSLFDFLTSSKLTTK